MKTLIPLFALTATVAVADPTSNYIDHFLGDYAAGGACQTSDFVLSLAPQSVTIGETRCTLSALTALPQNGLDLLLTRCQAEGTPAEDRAIQIHLTHTPTAGTLGLVTQNAPQPLSLRLCAS